MSSTTRSTARRTSTGWTAATIRTATYTYDAIGNLLTAGDPDSSYTMTYDELDRLASVDNLGTPGLPHVILTYAYDAVGNLIDTTENLGVSVVSTWDARNQLTSHTWTGGGIDPALIEFDYDARGQRTETRRHAYTPTAQQISRSTYGYDPVGRDADIEHLDAIDAVFVDYDFDFDLAGQLTSQSYNGQTVTYDYDPAGQVTSADHPSQADEGYTYDANGNRVGGGYVVGPNNRILSDGTFNYDYDAEGNLIRRTEIASGEYTEFEYDHRNRMVQGTIYSAGGIIVQEVEFTYDVFDRRIAKTVDADGAGPQPAETIYTVYDGQHAWADFNAAGSVVARYLFGDRIDDILARWRPGEGTAWYLTDHLGSIRDIIDAAGIVIDHIDYDSFGRIIAETNPAAGDRFKFTGREWDPELALYYYRARFYDPQLGRFVSEDPLGFAAGDANLFRYVGNNPLTFVDPTGNVSLSAYGKILHEDSRLAGALFGGTFGFICGYVSGWYSVPDSAVASPAHAAGRVALAVVTGLQYYAIGAAVGYALGPAAAAVAELDLFAKGVFLTIAAIFTIQEAGDIWNEDQPTEVKFKKLTACIILPVVVPAAGLAASKLANLPKFRPTLPRMPRPQPGALQPQGRPIVPAGQGNPFAGGAPPNLRPAPASPGPKAPTEKIFKAPQARKGQKQLTDGFDPKDFPLDDVNDGRAYFAKQRELADQYDDVYGDGVLELEIPKDVYDTRIKPHEVPYLSDPTFTELPLPHDTFDVLNDAIRRLHPTRKPGG